MAGNASGVDTLSGHPALFLILVKMRAQAVDHAIFRSLFQLLLDFFQGEMDDIVVMQLERRDGVAEAQPQPVQEIDFVGRQVRSVGTKNLIKLVPIGHVDFEVELGLGVAQLFPGFADQTGLLFRALS